MKPQASKDTPHNSSATQTGESADESLASLLARLESSAVETKEENVAFSHEELKGIIAGLEADISSGRWMKAYYADTDLRMMPALVEQANRKYPQMHLKLAMTPEDLSLSLKETIDAGIHTSRHIVNSGSSRIHFAVLDHRTIENKTSLILYEPTAFQHKSAAMLGLRTEQAIQDCQLPDYHFSMVEMDIQRSSSECGMFSLALAKKLYRESEKLTRIHQDNISGVLCEENAPLPSEKLDKYLPASFYKHTQGRTRLGEYLKSNPGAEHEKVNKKDETLVERFDKNLVEAEGKTVSVSSHKKRISEYKSALTL
ncbi:YopJ/AvrA family T3SS effector serine/threonine acetyltransferase [Bartonella sp. ML69XJBT]|uniref:YopJ/AvrA family T3SS effector serine/threonine acetyltransferase n=1 Tax=Bartonella sp. ML69XJBT TaxID=3019092 RepID=UPI00235F51F3|nr:YopJ/AvrA family T3SS effector serine/threonine acetyltransferase [Bartonella sp. ML69XJBT]